MKIAFKIKQYQLNRKKFLVIYLLESLIAVVDIAFEKELSKLIEGIDGMEREMMENESLEMKCVQKIGQYKENYERYKTLLGLLKIIIFMAL